MLSFFRRVLRNPVWVSKTPIITTLLLEAANVSQLHRMWTEGTAAGQSIWGWMMVNVALILWTNWYLTFTPDQRWAIRGTMFGIVMNSAVILTVLYFRWFV